MKLGWPIRNGQNQCKRSLFILNSSVQYRSRSGNARFPQCSSASIYLLETPRLSNITSLLFWTPFPLKISGLRARFKITTSDTLTSIFLRLYWAPAEPRRHNCYRHDLYAPWQVDWQAQKKINSENFETPNNRRLGPLQWTATAPLFTRIASVFYKVILFERFTLFP